MSIKAPAAPPAARPSPRRPAWLRLAGWLLVGAGALYALFAVTVAAATVAGLVGLAEPAPERATPPLFVAHAVSGAVALLAAAIQLGALTTPPPPRQRRLHRVLGRTYVVSAIVTSVLGVPVAVAFTVDGLARAGFLAEAALWLTTTVVAYIHIRAGRVRRHREWMIRSFALAAFFITFSLWDPALAALPMPPATAFGLAVVLGWLLNLIAAQLWIRHTRKQAVQ